MQRPAHMVQLDIDSACQADDVACQFKDAAVCPCRIIMPCQFSQQEPRCIMIQRTKTVNILVPHMGIAMDARPVVEALLLYGTGVDNTLPDYCGRFCVIGYIHKLVHRQRLHLKLNANAAKREAKVVLLWLI